MSMSLENGIGPPIGVQRNARVAHIRKYVCNPPERGHVLRLVAIEDPPTVLGEWMRNQCDDNGVTAEDVDARLRDHASTTGRDTEANLTWCAENSTVVCNKRLRCKPDNSAEQTLDPSLLAQAEALGIDGTNKGNAIQLSRALEGQLRLFMADAQTRRAEDRARERLQMEREQMYGTMLKDAWTACHQANLENDKLRHQQRRELDQAALQLREAIETEAPADEESEAKTEMIKMVTGALAQALPFIVAQVGKLMSESANTNGAPPDAKVG